VNITDSYLPAGLDAAVLSFSAYGEALFVSGDRKKALFFSLNMIIIASHFWL